MYPWLIGPVRDDNFEYLSFQKCKFLDHAAKDSSTDMSGWVRRILEKTNNLRLPQASKPVNVAANVNSSMFG